MQLYLSHSLLHLLSSLFKWQIYQRDWLTRSHTHEQQACVHVFEVKRVAINMVACHAPDCVRVCGKRECL